MWREDETLLGLMQDKNTFIRFSISSAEDVCMYSFIHSKIHTAINKENFNNKQ